VSKARLEAFSDGVFAVAITLLVLEIAVPGEHGGLAHQVGQLWPSFAGYAVSFTTIGIIWVNHHTMVTRFERLDRTILFLNLNLLLWVVLIPWSTALIAEHLRDTGADEHFAAAVYAGNFFVMGVSFFAIWFHAGRTGLLDVDERAWRNLVRRNTVGQGGYAVAFVLAWVSAPACLILCGLVAVYYILPGPVRI
jgi:TMEM175 potassium channel family protein